MGISFYFDEMMSRKAAEQLTRRGYIVLLANDVGMTQRLDTEHLTYASNHNHVMVTFDRPFAGKIAMSSIKHSGLICLSGEQNDIGRVVRLLIDFADQHQAESTRGQVFWLK